jgi:hypothetical protein
MEEYGLSSDELVAKEFRILQSSRPGFYPHVRKDWISAIKRIYRKHGDVSPKYLQAKHRPIYDQGRWIFGDFDKALGAAGFDPAKIRTRIHWDKNRIIAGVRRLRERKLPLSASYVRKNHANLFATALRFYGSWPNVLAAALPKERLPGKLMTPLQVLRALRDVKGEAAPSLRLQAEYYFGSVPKALSTIRKDERLRSGWSTEKILASLRRMHRQGRSLGYGDARRRAMALVSAAEVYFGSWGKALYAAGIDPNLYFVYHTWRKAKASNK